MIITQQEINQASMKATSYKQFKKNLEEMGCDVPINVRKFPHNMKGWKRKLRYELSQFNMNDVHPNASDLRNARYYKRLDRMGCPEPLVHM